MNNMVSVHDQAGKNCLSGGRRKYMLPRIERENIKKKLIGQEFLSLSHLIRDMG
jgi:hypothetical protein